MLRLALATLCALVLPTSAAAQCLDLVHRTPDPQADHWLNSVAIEGDLAAAGTMGDDDLAADAGSVYILERSASGWAFADELYASGAGANQYFGRDVALSGERLAAICDSTETVHIFERQSGAWSETATIQAPSAYPASQWFGNSLALEDDLLLVGDWGQSTAGTWFGAAHVYRKSAGVWSYEQTLARNGGESFDLFGWEVDIDAGRIVVGVPDARLTNGERRGGASVFERVSGIWTDVAFLPGNSDHSGFGRSVGISADTISVGAPFGPVLGDNEGGMLVFEKVGGTWTQTEHFKSGTSYYSQYGVDTVVDGERIALLAMDEVVKADPGIDSLAGGVVHLFARDASGWAEIGTHYASVGAGVVNLDLHAGELIFGQQLVNAVEVQIVPFGPRLVDPFCFCPATEAGCHNEDPLAGCANATGKGAYLAACGTTSVSADDLRFQVTGIVPKQFAILIMGRLVQGPSYLGNGRLCIGDQNAIRRFHVEKASNAGTLTYGPGIVAESLGFPPSGHILPGATWHFQTWYRDTGACMTGSNISSALAVTFAN